MSSNEAMYVAAFFEKLNQIVVLRNMSQYSHFHLTIVCLEQHISVFKQVMNGLILK